MSTEQTPQQPTQPATPKAPKGLQGGLQGLWVRLRESVLPEVHYLVGEQTKLIIRMAPYRQQVPQSILRGGGVLLLIDLILLLASRALAWSPVIQGVLGALAIALLYAVIHSIEDLLLHEQWQFILTDKRIVLITPDPDRHGFADAIYLKGGKIQVMDTNWSKNPIWGLFQATSGARDVMLSMSGYEFQETGAKVKGGLRFPDVMPDDILKLEQLIFG